MSERFFEMTDGGPAELFDDYHYSAVSLVTSFGDSECYTYLNAATCPECGGAMARLGSCFSCPGCGFATCHI